MKNYGDRRVLSVEAAPTYLDLIEVSNTWWSHDQKLPTLANTYPYLNHLNLDKGHSFTLW